MEKYMDIIYTHHQHQGGNQGREYKRVKAEGVGEKQGEEAGMMTNKMKMTDQRKWTRTYAANLQEKHGHRDLRQTYHSCIQQMYPYDNLRFKVQLQQPTSKM